MKLRNVYLAFRDQLPLKRFMRNLLNGNLRGLVHKRSHMTHEGNAKISYGSKKSAEKAAKKMMEKKGVYFSNYKCLYCDGWHLGKNWQTRKALEDGNSEQKSEV
jgi:hypothetical protein